MADSTSIPEEMHCPACGYSLYELQGDRCPECGYGIEGMRSRESGIPWVYRKQRGRFRTFWQTAWLVTFRNRSFCEEYARPVDYRAARRFQIGVVLYALVPVAALSAICHAFLPDGVNDVNDDLFGTRVASPMVDLVFIDGYLLALLNFCALMFLWLATGVPSYLFHPRALSIPRQNSAIAMSYYAAAPVALSALFQVAGLASLYSAGVLGFANWVVMLLFWICVLLPWCLFWATLVQTLRRVMPQLALQAPMAGVLIPLLWLALLVFCFFAWSAALIFPWIVWDSLR